MPRKNYKIAIVFLIISWGNLTLNYNIGGMKEVQNEPSLSNTTTAIAPNNKNIILMIGDGMGFEHLKLASWVEVGKDNKLSMESLQFKKNVTTYNLDNELTDSAAAATAIATGNKTKNHFLSILPTKEFVETILEICRGMGKSTGVITKTEITHPTPAAFMTHVSSRYNTSTIALQIVEDSRVDVLMGGGSNHFLDSQVVQMESNGYNIVRNITELENINTGKVFGLFAGSHLPYEIDRDRNVIPSLAEMTEKSLELLSQNPKGFFLLVEGGRIDHGAHSNNKVNVALEMIDFYYAIKVALSFINNNHNSLLIITADHETGGLDIIDDTLNEVLPSIDKTSEENKSLRIARVNNISVSWSTTGHTNRNIPYYSSRLATDDFEYIATIDNTDIFDIMKNYLEFNEKKPENFGLIIIIGIGVGIIITAVILVTFTREKKRAYL